MRILVAVALLFGVPAFALADSEDESWERWESQQIMLAEMERARKLGGFSDPVTALRNIFNGEATEKDVVGAYRSIRDLPEYGDLRADAPDQR